MLEIPTIRKSTFKVQELSKNYQHSFWYSICKNKSKNGDKFFRNCFISPSGDIEVVDEDWHHIEKALEIIQKLDAKNSNKINLIEERIWRMSEELENENYIIPWMTEQEKNEKKDFLAEQKEELRKLKEIHIEEDFKAVNRNRGFDAGEFLIIYHGYIALSDFNIMYYSTTKTQRHILNVRADKDEDGKEVLKPLSKEQINFKEKRRVIIDQITTAIEDNNYYSDSANGFHCPSGIPRIGWNSAKRLSDERYRRVRSESFLQEASKYGIKWPDVEYDYRFSGIRVKIDQQSFFIPGFKSELLF